MIFTSEQVSNGHPDKICDQISDAILTECLRQDRGSRVAIEAFIKDNNIVVGGELTTKAEVDYEKTIKEVLKRIGIEEYNSYKITSFIKKQSPDIAQGVNAGGAGDQGMMFGYATNETEEYMPLPYVIATKALLNLKKLNHKGLKPDAKSQVSYDYSNNRIDTFLISTQHSENMDIKEVRAVVKEVMIKTAKDMKLNTNFNVLVNPTGRFVVGGSFADAGLTGRKIIADTYGGMARHGGGAFSGKDPSKVDRSGAYISRKIAKDIVRNRWADRCEIQISYAIGVPRPTSVLVETFGTEHVDIEVIKDYVRTFDLTPRGIIDRLDLLNVDYNLTSAYGHFGKEELPWER